jgi:hypothetical protein
MDNLFLSREIGSVETGPQIFAGTSTPDTTFYFKKQQEEPGLLNSVLVSNGGWSRTNGVFNFSAEFEGKPYYNKAGDPDLFIAFFENFWGVYDFAESPLDPIYVSTQNVLYPWNANIWSSKQGYEPAPNVTKVI